MAGKPKVLAIRLFTEKVCLLLMDTLEIIYVECVFMTKILRNGVLLHVSPQHYIQWLLA